MSIKKHTTRGRGTNPTSRENLKKGAAARKWYVYGRGAGIGWTQLFGPYYLAKATEIEARLEGRNHTDLRPMYTVATEA